MNLSTRPSPFQDGSLQENHLCGPGLIFGRTLIFRPSQKLRCGKYLRPRGWAIYQNRFSGESFYC